MISLFIDKGWLDDGFSDPQWFVTNMNQEVVEVFDTYAEAEAYCNEVDPLD